MTTSTARPLDLAHCSEMPAIATCEQGWHVELYHPRVDRDGAQIIEARLACLFPQLATAYHYAASLAADLQECGLMAADEDDRAVGIGWLPHGDVMTGDRPVLVDGARPHTAGPARHPLADGLADAAFASVTLPRQGMRGLRCDHGWVFTLSIPHVTERFQFVELRAVCIDAAIEDAVDRLEATLDDLLSLRLLADPRAAEDIRFDLTSEPLGAVTSVDGAPTRPR